MKLRVLESICSAIPISSSQFGFPRCKNYQDPIQSTNWSTPNPTDSRTQDIMKATSTPVRIQKRKATDIATQSSRPLIAPVDLSYPVGSQKDSRLMHAISVSKNIICVYMYIDMAHKFNSKNKKTLPAKMLRAASLLFFARFSCWAL